MPSFAPHEGSCSRTRILGLLALSKKYTLLRMMPAPGL